MLDLDAQVFEAQLNDVRADLERLVDAPVRSILDLGAGTGTGTFGLLQHDTPDGGPRLTRAGLDAELDRTIIIDLTPPLPPVVSDYPFATLTGIRGALAGRLGVADSEQLDRLPKGGPSDVRRRRDLQVKAERQLWIARRPTSESA